MTWHTSLNALRDTLADLYPTDQDARRVAEQSGLSPQFIEFDGPGVNVWHGILVEADRRHKVEQLIDAARAEYPESTRLAEAIAAYHAAPRPAPDEALDEEPELKPIPGLPLPETLRRPRTLGWSASGIIALLVLAYFAFPRGPGGPNANPTPDSARATATAAALAAISTDTPTWTPSPAPMPTSTPTPVPTPAVMSGRFNIIVLPFGLIGPDGQAQPFEEGNALSEALYLKLRSEYDEHYPNLVGADAKLVQIWHTSMPDAPPLAPLPGSTDAERSAAAADLAERLRADLVVYANFVPMTTTLVFDLDFYYRSATLRAEPDAVAGRHRLGQVIDAPIALRDDPTLLREVIAEPLDIRARALFWLTVGLTYHIIDQPQQALTVFRRAEEELADWRETDGKEVLYYFIGREELALRNYAAAIQALDEAIRINPDYANAYVTLGALHFDRAQLFFIREQPVPEELAACISQENIDQAPADAEATMQEIDRAIEILMQALEAAPRSAWPPIENIARLTLGLVYRLKGQAYFFAGDYAAADEWLARGVDEMEAALPAFAEEQRQYAAWIHLGIAAAYHIQGYAELQRSPPDNPESSGSDRFDTAVDHFQSAQQHYQQCLDIGEPIIDLSFRRTVLDCGCRYYLKVARDAEAQVPTE